MTRQERKLQAFRKLHEVKVRKAFLSSIKKAATAIDVADLNRLLDVGDIEGAIKLLKPDTGLMGVIERAIKTTYEEAGAAVEVELPKIIGGKFGFSGSHPRAARIASEIAAQAITNIAASTEEAARTLIQSSVSEGKVTKKLAQELRSTIGLTKPQTKSVLNAQRALKSGHPDIMSKYLNLKLRDKRFDSLVKKHIKSGEPISAKDLKRIKAAHRAKSLRYRADLVARNETFTAQAMGRDESYLQVSERRDVETVTCRWQHNLSQNPRDDHLEVNGTVIEVGKYFNVGGVQMKHPHDPAGGADHSVGCRCIGIYRVVPKRPKKRVKRG